MSASIFAANIKHLRTAAGLSQPEFAKMISDRTGLDITRSAVSMWELGKRSPKMDIVVQLADLFGMSADALLGTEKSKWTVVEPEPPEITMIARAGKRMSPEQRDLMLKWAKLTFPEAFKEE